MPGQIVRRNKKTMAKYTHSDIRSADGGATVMVDYVIGYIAKLRESSKVTVQRPKTRKHGIACKGLSFDTLGPAFRGGGMSGSASCQLKRMIMAE